MNAQDFKNKLREIKNVLKSKEIVLEVFQNGKSEKFTFSTLKSFGKKVLELENQNCSFTFSKVSHDRADFNIVENVRQGKSRNLKSSFDKTLEYCLSKVPFKKMTIICYQN